MARGQLYIFSGPSGVGKDTILTEFLKNNPDVMLSISSITRPRRSADDDLKYHFISKEDFEAGIKNGDFLEYAEYCGNYYGTPKAPIEKWLDEGKDVIVEIEIQGAKKIMDSLEDVQSIFILPPSLKVLKKRLLKRSTEDDSQLEKRINKAREEISFALNYDYVIINDRLEDAVAMMESVFASQRARTEKNIDFIKGVLDNA